MLLGFPLRKRNGAFSLNGAYARSGKGKSPGGSLGFLYWCGKGGFMPLTRVDRVPTMVGYVPPKGFRIVSYRKLEDGSYEVTLEPEGLLS